MSEWPERTRREFVFVGTVVPDEYEFRNPAFSRAGNNFQANLIAAMYGLVRQPSTVLSARLEVTFPKSRKLWARGGEAQLPGGVTERLLPYLNITPLKQAWLGCATFFALTGWAWRTRKSPRTFLLYNLTVPPGVFVLLAARLTRSMIVAIIADVNIPGQTVPNTMLFTLDYWLQRWLMPRCDGLVVLSKAISSELAPSQPAILIEGGVPAAQLLRSQSLRRKRTGSGEHFVVAAVGSLDQANGFEEIIQAFDQLEGDGFRLVVAGAGPLEEMVRAAATRDPRIAYHGFVSYERVLTIYSEADVLVSMRLTKSVNTKFFFPSKLMECFASGTPVITTCPGNVEDEFADMAYLLREETPEALAALINHVRSEPSSERVDRSNRAWEYMAKHKTWEAQAAKVLRFIRGQSAPGAP